MTNKTTLFQVTATDGGDPPRSATASVVVVVQDVNDNDPVFAPAQYDVQLAEDEPPGTPVVTVTATDADEDNRLLITLDYSKISSQKRALLWRKKS